MVEVLEEEVVLLLVEVEPPFWEEEEVLEVRGDPWVGKGVSRKEDVQVVAVSILEEVDLSFQEEEAFLGFVVHSREVVVAFPWEDTLVVVLLVGCT